MPICVIHLSDIHLREQDNWISNRPRDIAIAARSVDRSCNEYLVLVSGDIAYSGKHEEYAHAAVFFDKLIEELSSENAALVRVAFVPGNHDCDLSKPSQVRQLLMQHPRDLETRASGDVVQECVSVQKEYFRFVARYSPQELPNGLPRLATSEVVQFHEGRIRLLLLNTAWLSKMHEEPGTSVFPVEAISDCLAGADNDECTIAVLHHPTNWLSPDNARSVRHAIDAASDFVLTGHEHKQDRYLKILRDGDQVGYFEAAVLQSGTPGASAFAVMMIDLGSASCTVTEYEWKSGMYQSRQSAPNIPFRRSRRGDPFQVHPDHQLWLEDLGTGFNHSRAPTLRLNDLFVPPAVLCRTVKAISETRLERRHEIDGVELFNHIFDAKKFIILGQSMAGKTTLSKVVFRDNLNRHVYPLLLKGDDLTVAMLDSTDKHLKRIFEQQYKGEWDRYNQLPPASKVLIIDDMHATGLNPRALGTLMRHFSARFERILLLADEFFGAQAFSSGSDEESYLAGFGTGTIQEFGHYLRAKLIEKWEILGRESTMTRDELSYDVRKIEKVVGGLLSKNFIPSLPVMTLTILQAWESTKTPDLSSGSYGYLQQTLILRALSTMKLTQPELDVALRFLAMVANTMFADDADVLSASRWTELERQYHHEFRVPLPTNLLARLQTARIVRSAGGQLEFQYPYYYCYFVARHLWETLQAEETGSGEVRALLDRMIRGVHYEQYANILTFYVFFSRDLVTIRRIIANAKTILSEYAPCNFESDVAFVNALYKGQGPPFKLPSAENEKNVDEYRKNLDRDETADAREAYTPREKRGGSVTRPEGEEEMSDFARINVATKMLHILGQVVRNSPGSLKADLKQEIITEAYNLGLRTLKALLTVPSENMDDVRTILISMIEADRQNQLEIMKERNAMSYLPELRKEDLLRKADEGVIWLAESFGYGITRRIALAIGMEELSDIYADVLKAAGGDIAYHIVDMAVKLEYFKEPPEREIQSLYEDLRKNQFAQDTLRGLVLTYLYLNPVEYKRRQRLEAGVLGFAKGGSPKLLDNPSKKKKR